MGVVINANVTIFSGSAPGLKAMFLGYLHAGGAGRQAWLSKTFNMLDIIKLLSVILMQDDQDRLR